MRLVVTEHKMAVRIPWRLRFRYWRWRRRQSKDVLFLIDAIGDEVTRQMVFGKDRD